MFDVQKRYRQLFFNKNSYNFENILDACTPPWEPGGLSRECVLRIPMRVVKGD